MKLSVILPTLHPEAARATADSVYAAMAHLPGLDFEIVACSPERVQGPRVVHVPEDTPEGSVAANLKALAASSGDLLLNLSDDVVLHPLAIRDALGCLLTREAIEGARPMLIGIHWLFENDDKGMIGTVWGRYYPYYFLMRRSERVGWMDRAYISHFADPDVAMKVYDAGGSCHLSPGILYRISQPDGPHKMASMARDMATFQMRWGAKFGGGWGTALREFNVDLSPQQPVAGLGVIFDRPDMMVDTVKAMVAGKQAA